MTTTMINANTSAARTTAHAQNGAQAGFRHSVLAEINHLNELPLTRSVMTTVMKHRHPALLISTLTAAAIVTSSDAESTRNAGVWALVGFGLNAFTAGLNIKQQTAADEPTTLDDQLKTNAPLIARNTLISGVIGHLLVSGDFRGAAIGALTGIGIGHASVAFKEGTLLPSLAQLQQSPELIKGLAMIGAVLGHAVRDPLILIAVAVAAAAPLMANLSARQAQPADASATTSDAPTPNTSPPDTSMPTNDAANPAGISSATDEPDIEVGQLARN